MASGAIAQIARRGGFLTPGGMWAAFATGVIVCAAGWGWAALLVMYFALSILLTRWGRAVKVARTESVLPSATDRSALQVFANGGLYAGAVLLGELTGDARWLLIGLGAIAAAAADTWATEVGTLWGGTPRSIITGVRMPPGVSGGVTAAGFAATFVAAALVAWAGGWLIPGEVDPSHTIVPALFIAGVVGSLGDSVIGATLQSRRWCEQCRTWTERRVHICQYRTQHARGLRWMTNDTVNFLATLIGAITALLIAQPALT